LSYRAVLGLPHARRLFTAALLPRLCYGLVGLTLLFTIRNDSGSIASAGLAVSVFGLAAALPGPARARLVARRPSAFTVLACLYATALLAIAIACPLHAPTLVVLGLALLAGLCPPPVGPVMRAYWSLIAPDESARQRALALDGAAESTVFALGPPLAGALIAACSAPAALAGCAVLAATGSLLFATAAKAIPSSTTPSSTTPSSTTPSSTVPSSTVPSSTAPSSTTRGKAGAAGASESFRIGRLLPFLVVTLAVAAAIAVADIAAAAAWGALSTGLLTALLPAGGVLGGLAYGRREWRVPLARRPLVLATGSAACYALPALAFGRASVGVAMLLAGACADILLVTVYQLADGMVAQAWVSTAYNLGGALGTAGGGALAARLGPQAAFAVVAVVAATCTVLAWAHAATTGMGATGATPAAPTRRRE
jgi:MFS family permease